MNKQEKISEYNNNNPGYYATNIKKMTNEQLKDYKIMAKGCNVDSLYKLYSNPSDAKINSWENILNTYKPIEVISVQGSCHQYSVFLQARNGDYLHITKANNYLIEV